MFAKKRVRVTQDISLAPYTILQKGEEGTIVRSDADGEGIYMMDVKLDREHKGLCHWSNTAHLAGPELEAISLVNRPRTVTIALSAMVAGFIISGLLGVVTAEAIEHAHRLSW